MACTNPATTEREPKQVSTVQRKPRILLATSGSIAAIKFANLCHCFSEWADVRAVATKASLHFIDKASMPRDVILYVDEDEWSTWTKIGDTVLHIELRIWADILVIAPLSANTLGKIAGGLCDNLLTSIVRAWDYSKPIFVAPAMNTLMWNNPFTERHLMLIDELGVSLIPPVTKRLACGDYGNGAMAEPSLIFSTVRLFVESRSRSGNHLQSCSNPFALPVHGIRRSIEEPLVKIEMLTPKDYIGPLMELAQDRRAEFKEMKFITEVRASLTYILPLAETLGEDQLCTLTCSSSLC